MQASKQSSLEMADGYGWMDGTGCLRRAGMRNQSPFIGLAYFFSSLSLSLPSLLVTMPICHCAARLGQPGKGARDEMRHILVAIECITASSRDNTICTVVCMCRHLSVSPWPAVPYRERAAEARTGVPGHQGWFGRGTWSDRVRPTFSGCGQWGGSWRVPCY